MSAQWTFENQMTNSGECNGSTMTPEFVIPELPDGEVLRFMLISSWDDPNYIAINTIEIFNSDGQRPKINKLETNATETVGTIENIFSNSEAQFPTSDPKKMWSARYDNIFDAIHIIAHLETIEKIAMIRIWNYNESRVHALRGVHDMRIELDNRVIFQGEISCAFTNHEDQSDWMGDTILFTTNDSILELIAKNDKFLYKDELMRRSSLDLFELSVDLIDDALSANRRAEAPAEDSISAAITHHRPETGDRKRVRQAPDPADVVDDDFGIAFLKSPTDEVNSLAPNAKAIAIDVSQKAQSFLTKVMHIEVLDNWGAPDCIGLTGLQFLDENGMVLDGTACSVSTSLESSSANRLINGKNLTCNRQDMWLAPFDRYSPESVGITITFNEPRSLSGICVWNYNASPEISYAGVRLAQFYLNGKQLNGAIMLRKAPGYICFDFVQDIFFNRCTIYRPLSRLHTRSISGFIYQLRMHCTWGDEYYIGLNGIEFFDNCDRLIPLHPQNLAAFPESVNILPNIVSDPRTCDKLIDGVNDTDIAHHMWLTPLLSNRCARIFIIFDYPTYVSRINIYNYRKTPSRGARLITISVDDLIVYSGELPQSSSQKTAVLQISLRET